MKSLRNSVQLIGRLGKDPEIRTFDNGKTLATFSVATSDYYKDDKGESVQDTQWHNVVAWNGKAELAERLLKKGIEVAIEGKLVHRSYETKAGDKRYVSEISLNELVMVGSREKDK